MRKRQSDEKPDWTFFGRRLGVSALFLNLSGLVGWFILAPQFAETDARTAVSFFADSEVPGSMILGAMYTPFSNWKEISSACVLDFHRELVFPRAALDVGEGSSW